MNLGLPVNLIATSAVVAISVVILCSRHSFAQMEGEVPAPAGEQTPPTAGTETEAKAEEEVVKPPEEEGAASEEELPPAGPATAPGEEDTGVSLDAEVKAPKKSPFRNSLFIYQNTFSARTLRRDAQLTYNPYYAMSYSFRPRYYLWKDLYVGIQWSIEQELTDADDTTKKRQPIWSDLLVDLVWGQAYTIPAAEIAISPQIRFELPASLASQAKTMYLSLGPGFSLRKTFDVLGGIMLQYFFRYTKYLNKYTSALSEEPILECPEEGPCRYDVIGPQNPSMRFSNNFLLEVRPIKKLYISVFLEVRNFILYKVPEAQYETLGGTKTLPSSGTRHLGYMWYIFELGYDLFPFLTLALGTSTYNPMLNPESKYYPPFFNRYTNIFFDVTIDLDGVVGAILKREEKSAIDRT